MVEIDSTALQQQWVHSHEEDVPDRLVFRPGSWAFPPSRGRRSFTLGTGGRLLASGPGRDDKTTQTIGHWRLLPDAVIELSQAGNTTRLKIIRLARDRLDIGR